MFKNNQKSRKLPYTPESPLSRLSCNFFTVDRPHIDCLMDSIHIFLDSIPGMSYNNSAGSKNNRQRKLPVNSNAGHDERGGMEIYMKKTLLMLAAVVLLGALVLTGCGNEKTETASAPATEAVSAPAETAAPAAEKPAEANAAASSTVSGYTVTVVDQNGAPVEGASLQMCSDQKCMNKKTDAEGKVSFSYSAGVYDLHLSKLPDGYSTDVKEMKTTADELNITLTVTKAG